MPSYRDRSSRPFRLAFIVLLLVAVALLARPIVFTGLRVAQFLRSPRMPGVTPAVVQNWLNDANPSHPIILDARGRAETRVSMLPGARRVDPDDEHPGRSLRLPPSTAVVVVSAVGWEAVTVAERLADAGFGPVMVMHGGIFRWANEGRPLETPERTHTGVVHPVSPVLGLLLLPDHRARP